MKTRPSLPELDVARIAPLPTDEKRNALHAFRVGVPPYSYKPVRSVTSDLLSLDAGMLGELERPQYEKIAQIIREKSKNAAEEAANLRVAKALYDQNWRGRRRDFMSVSTSIGERLTYWSSAVLGIDGKPVVPYFNQRQNRLPAHGMRFVFSMMHEQIRAADPDFADVSFAICHFTAAEKSRPRTANLTFDTGVELFTFDQLDAMIAETYAIWAEVWAGRTEEMRKRAGGTGTLL